MNTTLRFLLLPLFTALLAGILGILATTFLAHRGLYAMILPGGLVALGATLFPSHSRRILPLTCALYALAISLFTEWHIRPFLADPSLSYFLAHIQKLTPVTLLMIAAGTALAFFLPLTHARPRPSSPPSGPHD